MKEGPIRFANFNGLLQNTEKDLKELGAKQFWNGAGDREQKAREAIVALFFIAGFKRLTGINWWMVQEKIQFPDFKLVNFTGTEEAPSGNIMQFELVTVPDRCISFDAMYTIVKDKFQKYGLSPTTVVNLLIFVNNTQGKAWTSQLISKIGSYKPFTEIWTIRLLAEKEKGVVGVEILRVRPLEPFEKKRILFSDPDITNYPPPPDYMVTNESGLLEFSEKSKNQIRKLGMKKRMGKE